MRLPHARGGVSHDVPFFDRCRASSPRSWGCFQGRRRPQAGRTVFPTLVGVFLPPVICRRHSCCLPHARGGVSVAYSALLPVQKSSPRSWGCFQADFPIREVHDVFPTLVGVFLLAVATIGERDGLPHARGGVSAQRAADRPARSSSPRSWGCFHRRGEAGFCRVVFPTLVGVFLVVRRLAAAVAGLPHARGGVSPCIRLLFRQGASSPRSWGCFFLEQGLDGTERGLPHARGGVSSSRSD